MANAKGIMGELPEDKAEREWLYAIAAEFIVKQWEDEMEQAQISKEEQREIFAAAMSLPFYQDCK